MVQIGSELMDLNDDCLIQLFRYLPLKYLRAIGATLNGIVVHNVYRFHSSLTNFNVAAWAYRYINNEIKDDPEYIVKCINDYLKRFGHIIPIAYFWPYLTRI